MKSMRHWCANSLLKQNRLEFNSNTQFLRETKNLEIVIMLINCENHIEPVALNSCLAEQQSPPNLPRQYAVNARGYSQDQTCTSAARCHPSARQCNPQGGCRTQELRRLLYWELPGRLEFSADQAASGPLVESS